MLDFLIIFLENLKLVIGVLFAIIFVLFSIIGPFILTIVTGSLWWLLLYIPCIAIWITFDDWS